MSAPVKENYVHGLFAMYNCLIFQNEIPDNTNFVLEDLETCLVDGYWDPNSYTIGLDFNLEDEALRCTLLHEMIHAWDYKSRSVTDHGIVFQNKAYDILTLTGINVNR